MRNTKIHENTDSRDARQSTLLGTGGPSPGVQQYYTATGHVAPIASLPHGDSVYTLLRPPKSDHVLIGTKGGRILRVPITTEGNRDTTTLEVGSPVLSTALFSPSCLAIAVLDGRCVFWDMTAAQLVSTVPVDGQPVCSLMVLDGRGMIGLSTNGALLAWPDPGIASPQVLAQGASLPAMWAAVQLAYWPAGGAIAWPGADGLINIYDLLSSDLRTVRAHDGEVYAVFASGSTDGLITIGRQDRMLKAWRPNCNVPIVHCQAPAGVIAGVSLGGCPEAIVTIDDRGCAAQLLFDGHGLTPAWTLVGSDYRIAEQPSPDDLREWDQRRRADETRSIVHKINGLLAEERFFEVNPLHAQLHELGADTLSLELRVHEAYRRGNYPGQLIAAREFIARLDPHNPAMAAWLARFATLLEECGQPGEALRIRHQLTDCSPPDESNMQHMSRLQALISYIESCSPVLSSHLSIPLLLDVATILGHAFVGCWIWQQSDVYVAAAEISPAELIEMFNRPRPQDIAGPQSAVVTRPFCRLPTPGLTGANVVVASPATDLSLDGLRYGLHVEVTPAGTLLTGVSLIDTGPVDLAEPAAQRHERVRHTLTHTFATPRASLWIDRMHERMICAARRALTLKSTDRVPQGVNDVA